MVSLSFTTSPKVTQAPKEISETLSPHLPSFR